MDDKDGKDPEPRMKPTSPITSPVKIALEEIETLRRKFESTLNAYRDEVLGELDRVKAIVEKEAERRRIPADLIPDARDIVMVARQLEVKPEKGRRRDLKKIETALEEIQGIVKKWGM